MILPDHEIIRLCKEENLLTPFVEESIKVDQNGDKHVSHGPSSYGYDISLDNKFKLFKPSRNFLLNYLVQFDTFNKITKNRFLRVLDPTNFDDSLLTEIEGDYILIPPHSFVLGVSKEYFKMPKNVTGIVYNKSTYARLGTDCYTSVIEAGWEGNLVLEFSNDNPFYVKLSANQGIAQIVFHQSDKDCNITYADRGGKYMHQTGVQTAICK
jgi:dCTP deaminase